VAEDANQGETKMTSKTPKIAAVILALVALSAALPAFGANPVRTYVPFAFEAGTYSLPAGHYLVERGANGSFLYLHNLDKNNTIAVGTNPEGNSNDPKSPRLVFERLGEGYRLAEVWVAGSALGHSIQPTRQQMLVAARQARGERVVIALSRQ
jgi:hypothetical protein